MTLQNKILSGLNDLLHSFSFNEKLMPFLKRPMHLILYFSF